MIFKIIPLFSLVLTTLANCFYDCVFHRRRFNRFDDLNKGALTVLIRAIVAEFHDGLVGTGIERVEVLPLLLLHAIDRVLCDAFHTGLEVAAMKTGNDPLL